MVLLKDPRGTKKLQEKEKTRMMEQVSLMSLHHDAQREGRVTTLWDRNFMAAHAQRMI